LVIIDPKTEPKGRMPISKDRAREVLIVIPYSWTILAFGTEVISFKLYPNITALREIISPMMICRVLLFILSTSDDPVTYMGFFPSYLVGY
jgi:hypothetical protein